MRYLPLLLLSLLLAAPAAAAREPRAGDVFAELARSKQKRAAKKLPADPVVATITGCGGNRFTVAVGPAAGRAGKPARRAKIFASVEAVPLFGTAVKKPARDFGKTGTEAFSSLGSNAYVGIVRWSLKRGSRTIDKGLARTDTVKVAGKRGAGICTLPKGIAPRDAAPPTVAITPSDGAWKRGPLAVAFFAFDDFSGVQQIVSSVDGGPARSGASIVIAAEGVHSVQYAARDVAGNTSAAKTQVVRVDGGPPTAPAVVTPTAGSVTGDTTPTVVWDASTDSGSGVRLYSVVVRAGGAPIQNRFLAPTGASRERVDLTGLAAGTYTVQVFAADGADPPYLSSSSETPFTVQGGPPTATLDQAGQTLAAAVSGPFTVRFDRPMNPATVTPSTVTLTRPAGGAAPGYTVACGNPCTQATVTPTSPPLEGGYLVSWTAGAQSEDGVALTAGSAAFTAEAYRNSFGSQCGFTGDAPWTCGPDARSVNPTGRGALTSTKTFTSSAITIRGPGGAFSLSYTASHTDGCAADRGLIQVDAGGGFTTVATIDNTSKSETVAAGNGSGPGQIRLVHELGGVLAGCMDLTGAFTVDNLVLTR